MQPRRFECITVVDWSAAARPKTGADSVWIATIDTDGLTVTNPSTRHAAVDALDALVATGRSMLVGVDFSLGFPAGTAEALGLTGVPWRAIWDVLAGSIVDDRDNRNNRFEVAARLNERIGPGPGPFWGCPPSLATPTLTTTKPRIAQDSARGGPDEWRAVERRLRNQGHRPFSSWQLLGAGAVGSQSLVGIAALAALVDRWDDRIGVWPFTTGLAGIATSIDRVADGSPVIVAEVWPSFWPVDIPVGCVKDAAQVADTACRLFAADADGSLVDYFVPAPAETDMQVVLDEEGWVLGVR